MGGERGGRGRERGKEREGGGREREGEGEDGGRKGGGRDGERERVTSADSPTDQASSDHARRERLADSGTFTLVRRVLIAGDIGRGKVPFV